MLYTEEMHPQDWLLIIQALNEYIRLAKIDEPERADRADELVEAIAAEQGLGPVRCVDQIDYSWAG